MAPPRSPSSVRGEGGRPRSTEREAGALQARGPRSPPPSRLPGWRPSAQLLLPRPASGSAPSALLPPQPSTEQPGCRGRLATKLSREPAPVSRSGERAGRGQGLECGRGCGARLCVAGLGSGHPHGAAELSEPPAWGGRAPGPWRLWAARVGSRSAAGSAASCLIPSSGPRPDAHTPVALPGFASVRAPGVCLRLRQGGRVSVFPRAALGSEFDVPRSPSPSLECVEYARHWVSVISFGSPFNLMNRHYTHSTEKERGSERKSCDQEHHRVKERARVLNPSQPDPHHLMTCGQAPGSASPGVWCGKCGDHCPRSPTARLQTRGGPPPPHCASQRILWKDEWPLLSGSGFWRQKPVAAALSGDRSQIPEATLDFSGRSQGSQELERSSSSRKLLSFSGCLSPPPPPPKETLPRSLNLSEVSAAPGSW